MSRRDDRLCRVVADVLGEDATTIGDDSSPETTANWDSLNHLNIVLALESEFQIELPIEGVLQARSVGDLRALLRKQGAEV